MKTAIKTEEMQYGVGTPFPTVHSQAELERIAGFYCADKIAEEKPVKICYVLEQPHVVTATTSSQETGATEVTAWPVLPIANVGERKAITYAEALRRYEAGDMTDPGRCFTYKDIKINCGSAKKPDWWVMVGPEIIFTAARVCPFCAEPTDKGHICDPSKSPRPLIDPATICECGHPADFHAPFNSPVELPQECTKCDCDQFAEKKTELPADWEWDERTKPSFQAIKPNTNLRTLIFSRQQNAISAAWEIEAAQSAGLAGLAPNGLSGNGRSQAVDDFTADRCPECGRIDGAHTAECSHSDTPSYPIYLAFCKAQGIQRPAAAARKLELTRERDAEIIAWMAEQNREMAARVSRNGRAGERDTEELAIEKALHSSLHHIQGATARWRPLQESGATDAELIVAIANEFGLGGGSTAHGGYEHKGGKNPQFSWPTYNGAPKRTLKGKALLAKVRELLDIRAPGSSTSVETVSTEVESNGNGHIDLREIPLDQITPWQAGQMRSYFDPASLQELADSIQQKGVLQPILVRPMLPVFKVVVMADGLYGVISPGGVVVSTHATEQEAADNFEARARLKSEYELVAGERRWRASKLAGLATIPAIVRDLDDKSALEIQVVENLQRKGLSEVEEAQGYARLLEDYGYTADSLATKIGKSKSYVYARLKLNNLPPAAMEAVVKGDLPASIGELIGRIPSAKLREEFWQEEFGDFGMTYFDMPGFRDIKVEIERSYMRELKSAPFSRKDAKLCPEAGACVDCPKMTGNNRVEYPDGRADVCTDPGCFDAKVRAHNATLLAKYEKEGKEVIAGAAADKLFSKDYNGNYHLAYSAGKQYRSQDEDIYPTRGKSQKLKDLTVGLVDPVVAVDPNGQVHRLLPAKEVDQVLKQKGFTPLVQGRYSEESKERQKKEQQAKKIRQQAADEICRKIGFQASDRLKRDNEEFWRAITNSILGNADADTLRILARRREIKIKNNETRKAIPEILNDGADGGINGYIGIIAECFAAAELATWVLWDSSYNRDFPLCDHFGINPKAVQKRIATETTVAEKTKKKAKTNGSK
jgi:ParB/RepB/Spo0J family partition protein